MLHINPRKIFLFVFFTVFSLISLIFHATSPSTKPQKHVIGARPFGLFANFMSALHNLEWCTRNNRIPVIYWDNACLYYTKDGYNGSFNVWEYYFEPVSSLVYEKNDPLYTNWTDPDGRYIAYMVNAKTAPNAAKRLSIYNNVIKPFIKLNPLVQQKVDSFWHANMSGKHTIGIHLRGTDKHKEIKMVSPEVILQTAQRLAQPDSQFFIATDEEALLELAKKTLEGVVIYYDSHRSLDGSSLHHSGPFPMHLIGEEVVIEAWLLSRCDVFIHTSSYVSTAVLFLNPYLKNIFLTTS